MKRRRIAAYEILLFAALFAVTLISGIGAAYGGFGVDFSSGANINVARLPIVALTWLVGSGLLALMGTGRKNGK